MVKTYRTTFYMCGCGFETIHPGNASRHKKTKCEHKMNSESRNFVFENDYDDYKNIYESIKDDEIENLTNLVSTKIDENDKLNKIILQQRKTLLKISEIYEPESDDEDNDEGSGIIYYIIDKDLPSRGKIGRTKNTDLKKLKSRYSIFSKPIILCFYSTDIKKDENDLKTMLREHGCMDPSIGTETVVNCTETRALFHDFAGR